MSPGTDPAASSKAEHVSQLPVRRQLVFYLQFVYRYLFGLLVVLYASHFGVAPGWLSYEGALLIVLAHAIGTAACMLVARRRSRARKAQNLLLIFDLCVLALGLPLDPNPGMPLLYVFYLAFLDLGMRYGFELYRRHAYSAMLALAIAITIRALFTTEGLVLLDIWSAVLFMAILGYGLQVFASSGRTFSDLRDAQQRLALSLGAPGICTWDTDDPLRVLRPGSNFERVVGIPAAEFSDRMADYIAQIHPEDRERVVRHYSHFVHEPISEYEDEYRIHSLDGTQRTVNVRARAERDENGHARRVSGILWDISEQIRQREALTLMQERYRLATRAARVGVWVWNVARREFEIDESLRLLFGLSDQEAPDNSRQRLPQDEFFALMHADDQEGHARHVRSLLDSQASEYYREFRIPLRDGRVRDIQARGSIFRDDEGRILRVAGVAWDATALMEARRALEQKTDDLVRMDERYRLATHSARVGAWVWDIASASFELDASMNAVFEFDTTGNVAGTTLRVTMERFLARVHPEDREWLVQDGIERIKSSLGEYFQEYRILLDNGAVRGIQSRGSLFRNAQGRAVRAAGVIWDATELMEARNALERKTQELERANKELDDFSYTASHDLKEPLRGISNYARYLEEDYGATLDERGRGMLVKMREQARRMETLIMELLNVARLSRAPPAIEPNDLQAILQEVLDSLEFSLGEARVDIRVPRPLPTLPCDRVRVGELFRNLITNGIKYNDKPERWIEIGYDGADSDLSLYVRDNGIGIKPEHRARVFNLFQRLHTREAYGGGTGVGLTIAQKIVEMHQGRIWIESLPGYGTTFHFTLGKGTVA